MNGKPSSPVLRGLGASNCAQPLDRKTTTEEMCVSQYLSGETSRSQIAAVSSARSLLRSHWFAELAAVACGSPK
jgi:hypothetical protein